MREVLKRDNWPILAAGAALALSVVSIAASQICLGAAIVLTIRQWRSARYPPGAYLLLFFFVWTLLAAGLSNSPMSAWPQVRKFYVYLIVPCLAAAYRGRVAARTILLTMGLGGTLSAAWSLLQYAKKYSAAKAAGVNFTDAYIAARITGFMSHWMTFGGTMMAVFLLGTAYILFCKPIRWRVPAALAIVAIAIFLAWTRGIWIGTFAGTLYLIWFWRKLFVIALPILAIVSFAVMPQPEKDRVLSITQPRGDTDSNSHRKALFWTGIEIIKAHPLVGIGPEQVQRNFERYAPEYIPRPFPRSWWYGHLHNIYIQFSADRGIPAMLAIIGFFVWSTWTIARAAMHANDEVKWMLHGAAAFAIGILVTGVFEHNLADSEILMLALGLVTLGCSLATDRNNIPV
ncbi:MAG: O-antigen ligase family protein [Acidobacteria bacterium]|nr:O-antigen ligase family protein [Acidobacteriota bacterium]